MEVGSRFLGGVKSSDQSDKSNQSKSPSEDQECKASVTCHDKKQNEKMVYDHYEWPETGILRNYFSTGTNSNTVTQQEFHKIQEQIGARP